MQLEHCESHILHLTVFADLTRHIILRMFSTESMRNKKDYEMFGEKFEWIEIIEIDHPQ